MGRPTRLFLSLYLGFVVYSLGVLFLGETGAVARADLARVEARLQANMANLKQINVRLEREFDALRSDPSMIKLEARELGYYAPGERPIYLSGYGRRDSSYEVGTVVAADPAKMPGDSLFRLIGLAAALIFYVASGIFFQKKHETRRIRTPSENAAR